MVYLVAPSTAGFVPMELIPPLISPVLSASRPINFFSYRTKARNKLRMSIAFYRQKFLS